MIIENICHRLPVCVDDSQIIHGATACNTVDLYDGNVMTTDETETAMLAVAEGHYSLCTRGCFSQLEQNVHDNLIARLYDEAMTLADRLNNE